MKVLVWVAAAFGLGLFALGALVTFWGLGMLWGTSAVMKWLGRYLEWGALEGKVILDFETPFRIPPGKGCLDGR